MKSNAKLITMIMVMVILVTSLFGCVPQVTETSAPQPEAPAAQETEAPVVEETEAPATEAPAATEAPVEETEAAATEAPQTSGEPVTLRYANWNLGTEEENNINRQLVKAYTDANPHVTVEIVDMSGEGGWEANLTAYAAKGELPDVIMANNVPLYVQNGWVADLTDLVADDPDYADVPQVLKDAFTYDGRVLGLPYAQFLMGYFVNKDLFEAANLDAPEYGFTVEEFEEAVTEITDIDNAVLGADEIFPIQGWYPNTVDPDLKWYSYDGEKMNYNSAAFKEGVAFTEEMKPYTWQGLSEEQIANFKSVGPWELFLNQEVGLKWDATWAVPAWVQNATFEWDFIGFPGGNQAIVFDAFVISKTTENIQEAYNFAKWMTFSKEAYQKEAELARELGSAPKIPVSLDDESIATYKEFVDVPGVHTALENLNASVIESLPKIVPGYIAARWEGKPGIDVADQQDVTIGYIFDNATAGTFKFEDYSAQLEEFANNLMANAVEEMNQ
jgi:ABC-type glycerol-3-phosphate transport system substrate-binding protein